MADEDLSKQLEEERKRSRDIEKRLEREHAELLRREKDLDDWYGRSLQNVPQDEIYTIAAREKIDSLSYHLLRFAEKGKELERQVLDKDALLREKDAEIAGLRKELDDLKAAGARAAEELERLRAKERDEFERLRERHRKIDAYSKPKPAEEEESGGQRIDMADIASDKELGGIIPQESGVRKTAASKSIRDFLALLARLGRVRMVDASTLLNVDRKTIYSWVDVLEKKGYISVGSEKNDKILIATEKTLRLSRRFGR